MDAVQIVNFALAGLSIAFGAICFLAPAYAMGALKLAPVGGQMDGKSEVRGASGGAFIALGLAGMLFGPAWTVAWVMVGVHYAGAAAGRLLSFLFDGSRFASRRAERAALRNRTRFHQATTPSAAAAPGRNRRRR